MQRDHTTAPLSTAATSGTSPAERSKVLHCKEFRWQGVEEEAYKAEGSHFSGARRQALIGVRPGEEAPAFETRYFELAPGGYTSLEQHAHAHVVIVLRGCGEVILDQRLERIEPFTCIYIAPHALHQLHATSEQEPLGFLCIVDRERDRPQYPDATTLAWLREIPKIARRLRV
ncbi:cupin [Halorhodospira abdelmalekii]|uniref:cupin domain-containing protein n=1 Tax=Halorhodospira abdelmalekii TaxID=421629 RepID=UPI0019086941|nr:cupin domain-containing protein [Halorhodospira abdelmalekii]MBK1735870.1 cupin [Halorhodospira abdelmalekii]